MVYTKEVIALSSITGQIIAGGKRNFDAIPMFQITCIREMEKKPKSSVEAGHSPEIVDACECSNNLAAQPHPMEKDQPLPLGHNVMLKFANSLQIKTTDDGLNCGRSYHLKASCKLPLDPHKP